MTNNVNAIIVGQGIAGTLISHALHSRGQAVMVIDHPHDYSASKAAAGLINPITGRYYTKSWMIDQLLPFAIKIYQSLEKLLGNSYWIPSTIYRTLHNVKQCNDWSARLLQEPYTHYAASTPDHGPYKHTVSDGAGVALIKHGGRVEINALLHDYKTFLIANKAYRNEDFLHTDLQSIDGKILYHDIEADYLVFAEGIGMADNPYFKDLPLQPAKGEALHVRIPHLNEISSILKHQQYLVPMQMAGVYWSGGGFKWKYDSTQPTQDFRTDYESALSAFIDTEFTVEGHVAGVRPCVIDRKPLIGRHNDTAIFAFNGLGTKGTSLGPYFANLLADHILNGSELSSEVDLNRFR